MMQLVICLMGLQCSGIYLMENYLVEAYGVKRYKGYTTRKRKKHEEGNTYNFLNVDQMIDEDYALLAWREYKGDFYARKLQDIPEGISVCVIDYNGYLELKDKVNTLPIYINRGIKYRFKNCNSQWDIGYNEFLQRDFVDRVQFDLLVYDKEVIKINHEGINNVFLIIDDIIFPYLKEIDKQKNIEDARLKIMYEKMSKEA
jgi:hypothetical protein